MQITLSAEAKKGILFQILLDARDKFIPDGFIDWNGSWGVWLNLQFMQSKIEKKGIFRKKNIPVEDTVLIHCIEIKDIRNDLLFSDLDWGDLKIKSCNKNYDKVAEYIAQELSKFVPPNQLHLVLNNVTKVETMQNPSKR